ncbi:MAG TPA: protein-L-isoaspartate(D-aspartate) O-methyltransferase [Spongiibacteraceae bacterium]|nr:protein-L-isoaspartate O-methyltransferase [Spongiibacteraceae bacterium]HCS29005.1 protein-L-isoaspartate(D-aspartate) O-methyltransferase [Spongiibacteraceae bacterium]|tara:strand:+ start:117 stop:782 length:666 start_codon:yes stop_codon:yes gene_type:complete
MTQLNLGGIGMTSQRTRDRLISRLREQGVTDQAVLDVMARTPRHIFLDEALAHRAYEDSALPIGYQQTLSQPYIVARMTELLLSTGPRKRVLEVGTGSGYQTAVLAQLVDRVYSVERILPLQSKARERMRMLGLSNVHLKHADGGMGWEERGPYDGILVTAAPETIPQALIDQLADGGMLVIPVGNSRHQQLRLLKKQGESLEELSIEAVMFVPLVSGRVG